ncbi:MAG TPA: TonB-dependent receptor [Novimethylophilus sp.]|uniref:TonB-dependent receptor domain-containing protein n=1 Tax=Novimethylophilus sp. TaxID=2137426 RepID=UPI002F401917
MKKTTLVSLIGLLASFPLYAHETIYSDDVVVTASRVPQSRESVVADVSVIEREEIEHAGQSTLVELLSTMPGVEIESNGGPGATANVHLRGTSSQAVVVLIDGMRLGSATLGTTAFNQISPEQIERIEIVRGAVSSLYGSDAVGGVIQIFTRQGAGKPHLSAYAGYGSYNTREGAASLSGAADNTRFALNVSSLATDGISSLRTKIGRDADDDGYRNLTVSGHLTQTLALGHEIGLQFFRSDGHSDFDDNNFTAFQDMKQHSFAVTSKNQFMAGWLSQLKLGESMDDLVSVGSFGTSALRTYQRQYSWQNDLSLPLGVLALAYDRLEDHVVGNTAFSKNRRRNNGWLASYLLEQGPHAFHAGIRRDDNSQFGRHDTGNIGYGYKFNQFWRVTGNYGTAFRAPTFNDLYWPFQDFGFGFSYRGNPNLKPETSRNKEISVVFDQGHHRVSATAYRNEISNLLVCCQGLPADFPTNVGSATIQGLTIAYEGWFDSYHLRANVDFQDPKDDDTGKQLVRRARQHAALWLGKTMGQAEVAGEVVASGKRYNDAANAFKLDGYALVNLTAAYKLGDDWSINARLNNLFDRKYALATTANSFAPNAPDFNTPGTNLFVGLRYAPK